MIASPCLGKCKVQNGFCIGCSRTLNEISRWVSLSDEQRDYKINSVRRLISTHTCPGCQKPAQCDISAGKESCWCFDVPKYDLSKPASDGTQCYCRQCLSSLVGKQ